MERPPSNAPGGRSAPIWYLRSYKDQDTHAAAGPIAADGTVTSCCGLTFRPVAHPLDGAPAALTSPPDPLQACPACRRGGAR